MAGKVLVTGTGGFIGGAMVRALDAQGFKVRATAVKKPEFLGNGGLGNTEFVASDMTDRESLTRVVDGVDRVYHCAAVFNFHDDESLLQRVNAEGTRELTEAAQKAGVKEFVNWSSGAIYGLAYGNEAVSEDHEPRPHDKYTRSKWAQEQAAFAANGQAMRVLTLRPAAVYGPGSDYGDATALYLLKRGILCVVPGFSDFYSSHVHVDDVVAAAIHLSEDPANYNPAAKKPGEVAFNVSDDRPVSVKELLKTAASLMPDKGLLGFLHLRVPVFPLRAVAWASETFGKLTGKPPLIEIDSIDYIAGGHAMKNDKLKRTGYRLKYPEVSQALGELIQWYESREWSMFR
jgi:nucleoside-diphosphate-sugar epimerase